MTYEEMTRKIRTAGTWFTGVFMGEILKRYPEFHDDSVLKTEFIRYMHNEYGKALDYTFDSTKSKCYAIMAIIREHRVIDALDYILQSNEKKVPEDARESADNLLNKIISGDILLP